MKQKELDEVLYCLGNDRKVFYYFKDKYCLDMLKLHMKKARKQHLPISELKQKPWQPFATKPVVKDIIKYCGNGILPKDLLYSYWPDEILTFTLTLDRWGEGDRYYDQTFRNQQNLVLQINFSNEHNQHYHRLLRPYDSYGPFEYRGHPIRQDKRKTLSWARIDFDLTTGEALVEEVQNDWLRNVHWDMQRVARRYAKKSTIKPGDIIHGITCEYKELKQYADIILAPYKKLWAELSLMATIQFIRNELGISTIYYHTFDTGRKIKNIVGLPPKSMYTKLPKQFGFELSDENPVFLAEHKKASRYLKAIKHTKWYQLSL